MKLRSVTSGFALALMGALLVACGGGGGGGGSSRGGGTSRGNGSKAPKAGPRTTTRSTFVGGRIKVTEVDTSRLANSVVAITIKNTSGRNLSNLEYSVALYYKNTDPKTRSTQPETVVLTSWSSFALDAGDRFTIRTKSGSAKATRALLSVRPAELRDTAAGERRYSDRIVVTKVDKDEFATPARLDYTIKNVSSDPQSVRFCVVFSKRGKEVGRTQWASAGSIPSGSSKRLRANLSGLKVDVLGTKETLLVERGGF